MRILGNGRPGFRSSGKLTVGRAEVGDLRVNAGFNYPLGYLAERNLLGIAVLRRTGEVLSINDYYLSKILGLSRDQFVQEGLNIHDVTSDGLDDNASARERFERNGFVEPFEAMRTRRDGSTIWTLQGYAAFDNNPELIATFALDITDKKRAEITSQYLLEANKIMASSVELQPLLEKIVQVTLVNGFCDFCTIHLREPDDRLVCRAMIHKDSELHQQIQRIIERYPNYLSEAIGPARVIRTGKSEMSGGGATGTLSHPVGALMLKSYISVPLNLHGETIGALTLTSLAKKFDPEDLKTAEALALRASQHIENAKLHEELKKGKLELERSNRDLTHYASIAAHDLKSPLATAQSYLNLLLEECGGGLEDTHRKWLEKVIDSHSKLLSQVDRLLSLSHTEPDEVTRLEADLNSIVRSAIENLKSEVEGSRAQFVYGPLPAIKGDSTLLTLLFQNLFANSIRYRNPQEPPVIRITAEQSPAGWTVHVSDNGDGFDADCAEKIFRLFERGRDGHDGHGIGLATCRKIIEGHNGKIWAESTPGQGARFSFTLPD